MTDYFDSEDIALDSRVLLPAPEPAQRMNRSLAVADPELAALIEKEKYRQIHGIELIASENFTSRAVLECLGSCLTNKYSEGQPESRYYGGNEIIDQIETLCKTRCLSAFQLKSDIWDVNVQPYSGSPANLAVYIGLLRPHDRLMGLGLSSGGHLTHGFYTPTKKLSASSIFFESFPYDVNEETGLIDFDNLRKTALIYRPHLIICGASAYPRHLDFKQFRAIADECNAMLMADIAHIAGLVAADVHPSPFAYCEIVTTTTHKTLRGPRSGIIFINKERLGPRGKDLIDQAVFPGLQGGPHNHQIAAVATQMKEVRSPEWVAYAEQIVANSRTLAKLLIDKGCKLVTGGTDNHLIVWDLRPLGITGSKFEKLAEGVGISLNKNVVPGDTSALHPNGVRIGTPAMTTRGCKEEDMKSIAYFLMECAKLCVEIQTQSGKILSQFTSVMKTNPGFLNLKNCVEEFAIKFPFPNSS